MRLLQPPVITILCLACLSGDPAVDAAALAAKPDRPNFVVIYVDDLDFDELAPYDYREFPSYTGAWEAGVYNPPEEDAYFVQTHWTKPGERTYFENPRQYTPNFDRLAREGLRFDRFYVTSTVCTPSRYSLFTGNYASACPSLEAPGEHPLKNILWNTPLAPQEDNLFKRLNATGYETGLAGKWHNHFYEPGAAEPYTWQTIYPDIANDADPRDPAVAARIERGYARAVEHLRENIGFDYVGGLYPGNIHQSGLPRSLRHNNLEWITEAALDFVRQPREEPFFLLFSINLPHRQNSAWENDHDPLATPTGFLDEAPTPFAPREALMARMRAAGVDPQHFSSTWIDAAVGALLDELEARGLAENTLVWFISDHQSRGKFTCYEAARVPAFAWWPGRVPAGRQTESLAANIDVSPTLLDLAGAPVPEGTFDGIDLTPLLLEGEPPDRDHLFLESGYSRAVVTNRYKLIENIPPPWVERKMEADRRESLETGEPRTVGWDGGESGTPWGVRYGADAEFPHYFDAVQLYDLKADPFEQENLIESGTLAGIEAELRQRLDSFLNRSRDRH